MQRFATVAARPDEDRSPAVAALANRILDADLGQSVQPFQAIMDDPPTMILDPDDIPFIPVQIQRRLVVDRPFFVVVLQLEDYQISQFRFRSHPADPDTIVTLRGDQPGHRRAVRVRLVLDPDSRPFRDEIVMQLVHQPAAQFRMVPIDGVIHDPDRNPQAPGKRPSAS